MYNESLNKYTGTLDIKRSSRGVTAGQEAGEKRAIGDGGTGGCGWVLFKAGWQVQGRSFFIPCCTP